MYGQEGRELTMDEDTSKSILFVCLGNICRSPLAQGIMENLLERAGITDIRVDSAGTAAYHQGELPDPRSRQEAQRHGIVLEHRARKIKPSDFTDFQFIAAMDRENLQNLRAVCPQGLEYKIFPIMNLVPGQEGADVPDPYYGGPEGFAKVYHMLDSACEKLLERFQKIP